MLLLTSFTGSAIDHDVHLTTECLRMLQCVKGRHVRMVTECVGHAQDQGCM